MTYHFQQNGQTVDQLDAVVVNNGRAYEITYANAAGAEAADRALFLVILATFSFLNSGF